jgi:hypothetical protein
MLDHDYHPHPFPASTKLPLLIKERQHLISKPLIQSSCLQESSAPSSAALPPLKESQERCLVTYFLSFLKQRNSDSVYLISPA